MKLFGTDGIRGKANQFPITGEMALLVGKAVAHALSRKNGNGKHKVLIGKDTRLSGYMLETALTSGIVSMGCDVLLVGPLPTPAIAYLTKKLGADAGIMLSASHNPAEDNGIKIFDGNGVKLMDKLAEEIEGLVEDHDKLEAMHVSHDKIGKATRVDDAMSVYLNFLEKQSRVKSLQDIKVVIDCANGASYKAAPSLLRGLGAEVVALYNNPDGLNINENCGATHPKNMADATKGLKANIGIALDGDADRVIVADENGKILSGDHIIAILAEDRKGRGELEKDTVVVTPHSNLGFMERMKELGIEVGIAAVGDRFVLEEMQKRDALLGGEECGHIMCCKEMSLDDGLFAALELLGVMKETGKKLSDLASTIKIYPQKLINVEVRDKKDIESLFTVQEKIKEAEKELGEKGRVFVRYSGTQNMARVMVEAKEEKLAERLASSIAQAFEKEIGAN